MSKVVLVTGTSTGLGLSISIQAARNGNVVYATMRKLEKRDALETAARSAGVRLRILQLDVQHTDSINAAVDQIIAEDGRIDVLVNNAGAGFVRTVEQASEDDIRWVTDVNYMGVVRCTKAVLPHMRKARSGHVVTVSSVGGLVGQPFNELYCGAKFAVEGFMESLATYVTPSFGIHFSVVEPGGISSEFASRAMEHVEQTGGMLDDEYLPILQDYVGNATKRQAGSDIYQTPDEVAAIIIDRLNAQDPPVRMRTSKWSEAFTGLKTGLGLDGKKQQAKVVEQFLK